MATFTGLPSEILLHILCFLDTASIQQLQLTSKKFRDIGRDDTYWKQRCFQRSTRSDALRLGPIQYSLNEHVQIRPRPINQSEKIRKMANWDPSFPSENVSWYEEYIQRHATIAVSWLQQPQMRDRTVSASIEARGMALYRPDNASQGDQPETLLAVAPLDDGSVCLWDVNGTHGKRGAIYAKSAPGILFIDGPSADNSSRSKRIDSGVTECVSVDSQRHLAYFAVQSHLIEVDLRRLSVVECESFPWSITALSDAHPAVPLTVGTNLGIHMHDSRAHVTRAPGDADKLDDLGSLVAKNFYERSLKELFDGTPLPPYASLAQPGPLSILHPQRPGAPHDLSDDIYVAGRFSNILHYDRRKFPSIKGSIHSGARLCSLTAMPYPFSALDSELRSTSELSVDQVERSKTATGGRTLVACGEYNTKGSLELYGLCAPERASPGSPGGLHNSVLKNRQTASHAKLLSVVNHGTRLVLSDGAGMLKWFERDGFTEVRRCRIGHYERQQQAPSIFSSMPGSDDIARKLLATGPSNGACEDRLNNNDLLFWTGEKLGLVGFSSGGGFTADLEPEEESKTPEERAAEEEERSYGERMRRALQRQADDVRFVRNLGYGSR